MCYILGYKACLAEALGLTRKRSVYFRKRELSGKVWGFDNVFR